MAKKTAKKKVAKKRTAKKKTVKKKASKKAIGKKVSKKKLVKKKAVKKKLAKKKAAKKKTAKKTGAKKSTSKKRLSKKTVAKKKTTRKKASKKSLTKKKPIKKKAVTKKTSTKKVSQASKSSLKLGEYVPSLLLDVTGSSKEFSLAQSYKKYRVLYFYPKDNTPGCTLEGHDFTDHLKKFKALETEVFGVSRDSLKSHEGFKAKQAYKHELISDPQEELCHIFGVMKEKSLYGRKYVGVDRSTFIIDPDGMLVHEWRSVKVKGHVEQVLEKLNELTESKKGGLFSNLKGLF